MKSKKKVLISLFLVLVMLTLTSSPVLSADVKEEPTAVTEQAGASITSDAVSSDVKEEVVALNVYSLNKSECMIAEYVNTEEFNKASHVKRLNDEEELDTYVFLNSDGTKSVYYMDENVKFIDKNGDVKEKDVSLVKKTDGFGIVRNEFDLHIPNAASSGISMSYNGYDVKLIPQTSVRAVPARQNGDTVVYDGFFGTNTSLVYTPMLSGVKEDVVMKAYIPNAEFRFVLETDGLGLYLGKDGYYLAESETSEAVLSLGNVIIYDAIGKPDYGTMTVTTVTEGQKYILSLSAPEEFLTDPTTVYPVTIDPTLTVSDTATGDGAIEDTVLFSGRPTKNYGDYKYLSIGYVDSTYGVGKVAVKLPGLYNSFEYQNTIGANISSVKFYCHDSSGNGEQYVNLYRITGPSWNENETYWNRAHVCDTSTNWGASMSNGTWTEFNITTLVKAWRLGTYSPELGFMLTNPNTTSASYKKAPYSSEYTGTALRPYVMMTYEPYGIDFDSAAPLSLDTTIVVNINSSGLEKYYEFTPSSNGFYTFESFSNNGDPYARLYNSNQEQIAYNDDDAGNSNFRITYHLLAGNVYYFAARCYASGTGNYCAKLTFNVACNEATIPTDVYYVKNIGSKKCIDIDGPSAQEWIHQWDLHAGAQVRWKIQKQSDGYYTIRSEYGSKYYIGVSNAASDVNNIKLYSGISDKTKWKLYRNNAGSLIIEPKTASGNVLYAPDSLSGTRLQLSTLSASVSNRSLWDIAYVVAFLESSIPSKTFNLQCATNTVNNSVWYPLIVDSVNAWNTSSANTDITLSTISSSYTIEVGSYADSWYGATWKQEISGTSLTKAAITINSRTLSTDSNIRRSTITHEIGHLLGLKDNPPVSNNDSLMMHSRDRSVVFVPKDFDTHNVKFLYD